MSTLENRINKMRSKADAKSAEYKDLYEKQKQEAEQAADEEAKAFGNEEMISTTTPDETLLHKAEKIQERADKREGVMRSNAEWWEWIKGGMNSAPATTPQSDTTNQPQTTPQQTATTTPPQVTTNQPQTNAEESVTPQATTTTPTAEPKSTVEEILGKAVANTQDANKRKAEALAAYQTATSNNQSAYQQLVKDALKRKENLVVKQERDARTKALINALGSLVNVITAGAIAKRNDSIPIIAEYDKEPDSALRKSIEGRYAMQNENEGLLVKLEQERMRHEADLAKQNYDQEVGAIDAETKAKNDILGKLAEGELYKDRVDYRVNAEAAKQKSVHDHKVENPLPSQKGDGKKKPKPFEYNKDKLKQFVTNATSWEKRDYSDPLYIERDEKGAVKYGEDGKPIKYKTVKYSAKPNDVQYIVANQAAKRLQENNVSDDYQTKLQSVYNTLFQDAYYGKVISEKIGSSLIDGLIQYINNANAKKEVLTDKELLALAERTINEIVKNSQING